MDPNGNHVGFIAEEESGIAKIIARQWFRTHRAFTTHVFDRDEREVLRVSLTIPSHTSSTFNLTNS